MAVVDRRGVTLESIDTPVAGGPSATLAIKAPCLLATTANIVLDGLQTIDGIALGGGERILVWKQSDATLNGIYNASSGVWTRTVDADTNDQWGQGLLILVTSGTSNAHTLFECTAQNPITLSSSAITFAPHSLATLT